MCVCTYVKTPNSVGKYKRLIIRVVLIVIKAGIITGICGLKYKKLNQSSHV